MARKRQLTVEERQTIITLKNVGLFYREIAKTFKVSVSTVPSPSNSTQKLGNSDRKRSGRPKATTESEDKFLRVNSLCDRRQSFSSDPSIKTIIRRRAQSLPSSAERKKELRSVQVRFVDSLGLQLEEVKVFKVQECPIIPQHVIFRLLMSSELAFGKSLELSLPYFKPCFPENMGAQPDFLTRLHTQRVCLEQILCSEQGITGTIQVFNVAYEKEVTVHYSFTNWRTHTNTAASWLSSVYREGCDSPVLDVFRFRLPVPPFALQPGASLEFAICYHVKGSDYWDNNNGNNYKLSCHSYKVSVAPAICSSQDKAGDS
uniref:Protein phosphatase 1, regulatory subunit 3Db n=1 Tax=Neolamprologus brichardi TaxID=32507 RepID=A0A3Q4HFK6_NEOBR